MFRSFSKFREQLDTVQAETVFLDAQRDLLGGTLERRRRVSTAAKAVSILVLGTPFLSFFLGLALIVFTFPNLLAIIGGGLLIALGLVLRPRKARNTEKTLYRQDLPETFAMLDQLADDMETERITGIHLFSDCNAYMLHVQGERILGIGAILWRACDDGEKLAVLAHELAHQLNGDPARYGLTNAALNTLDGWLWYLEPDAEEVLTELIMYIPFLAVSAVAKLLLRLVYLESQRAEYLADAIAARSAGTKGMQSVLEKLSMSERLDTEFLGMHVNRAPSGLEMIDRLARVISEVPDDERNRILKTMRDKKLSVDASHPPSHYRIAFLELLQDAGFPEIGRDHNLEPADVELTKILAPQGDEILSNLQQSSGHY